jgi:endonuclease/exonuclease/phosphatase family metal-dependent hydrolase
VLVGRRLAALAAALLLLSGCAAARPLPLADRTLGRDVVLAALTWNVHSGRGDLRLLMDDLRDGRLTGQPVEDYVVFLQETIEGGDHDVVAVARERGLSTHFVPVRVSDRGVSGNAILSTRPLLDPRTIDLPRIRRVRKAVAATIDIDGQRLLIVCTHFENRVRWLSGVLFFSDRARARQAAALLDTLPDGPGILGGDLNTWLGPGEPAWRALLERFGDTPSDRLEPTFLDRLVLDHLFFDLPGGWEATTDVVDNRYGSDHHPVVGVIVEKK